jgi:hypothetical protein
MLLDAGAALEAAPDWYATGRQRALEPAPSI